MGIRIFWSNRLNKVFGMYLYLAKHNLFIWHGTLLYLQYVLEVLLPKQAYNKATNLSPGDVCVQTHNMSYNKGGILFSPGIQKLLLEKMKGKKNLPLTFWQTETTGVGGHFTKVRKTGKGSGKRVDRKNFWKHKHCRTLPEEKRLWMEMPHMELQTGLTLKALGYFNSPSPVPQEGCWLSKTTLVFSEIHYEVNTISPYI